MYVHRTQIEKKIKFSWYIMKFRMEQLQIWLTASLYMGKYLRISSYSRKPFLIYDFATAPLWIPYIWGKFYFIFYLVLFTYTWGAIEKLIIQNILYFKYISKILYVKYSNSHWVILYLRDWQVSPDVVRVWLQLNK